MKKYIKHIAIISFLAIANLLAFTRVHAQQLANADTWVKTWADTATSYKSVAPELIADETTITYLKNDAKIECNNQEVFYKLFTSYYQLFTRFTATWKVDKRGNAYKHYVIHLNKEDAGIIKLWAKNNL